jgi:quercetin dioxygenase-like cupin family protein
MYVLACAAFLASGLVVGAQQQPQQTVVWAPKPTQLPAYGSPQRPHVKLTELKARHRGEQNWRELLVDDGHLQAEYISAAPGSTVSKRLHPDSRAWWVVVDGQMRVDIDGQPSFTATKGSLVQVPKQTIYSMETIGDRPSLRFAVNVAGAKTLYPQDVQPPSMPGLKWVPIPLNRNPAPYENGNRPHINLDEAAKAPKYTGQPFVRDDKASATIIYGYEKDLPPLDPKDRGHFHPDSPEFWLVMAGQIEYLFENRDVFVADEGDVAYVPPSTYHRARFHGAGPSCRLAITRFINNTALIER